MDPVFASERIQQEWSDLRLDGNVKTIVQEAVDFLWGKYGFSPTITCIFRTATENTADHAETMIHMVWRAVDMRVNDMPPGAQAAVVSKMNSEWVYDVGRPYLLVAYDRPHGTGPHIHWQSHPNTHRRG